MGQIRLFAAAAEKQRREDLANMVLACTAGARYDEKSLKKLFKELQP